MRKGSLLFAILVMAITGSSQSYSVKWGEEMKMKKGTVDMDIITADNSGLYFSESRRVATFGGSPETIKLMKMDKNFSEVFDKTYKKELKGLSFHSFQPLENDLYMFATDYIRKERRFIVFGSKVDKNSGELVGDFIELGSYDQESKRDGFEMRVSPMLDGKSFLMVSNISGTDRVSLGIIVLDKGLKRKQSAVIDLSFNPKEYSLQDVKFTKNNKIVLLGKESEETQYGKKKRKRMIFRQYVMAVYNENGKKENEVRLNSGEKYIISGKLIEQANGEMLLAGFYSNEAKKEDLNGFYINKVDPVKGELLLSSYKEINTGMLSKGFIDETDDDDMSKQEKKEAKKAKDDDEEDEFPNSFVIRTVDINPSDNSIIITSEVSKYSVYTYTSSSYSNTSRSWTYRTTTVHTFTNQDILVINADKDGKIKWLNALPKSQLEKISSSSNSYTGFSISYDYSGYFANGGALPYYSSYKTMLKDNNLVVLMNDHNSNNVTAEYGDKVKTVFNFRKRSSVYGISIDLATGKMSRKNIASNNDETIMMPRHAYVVENEFFIPSWRQHTMARTEMRFARITVK